ncbi:MAG TPA: U32 family peptidase [Candidatus Avacidaminococcus intestinavium]|uniref:U32 family peptidase n=1 Tax=Candidatus Avacidaminococcus intestinavium TaxID=2840684 RepID=A0A9D1MQH0_9FIRM|nr:U32 family peptidase [Candidatus Avacidaminococcus intestinavium]
MDNNRQNVINKKPELLAPAGSMEKGKMALLYGADAIYLGGNKFGLRAFAANFTYAEITEITNFAHKREKKVYVTVNIFAHNEDLSGLPDYLLSLENCGVDALLISDLGIWSIARQTVPNMELHVSTQANSTNWAAVEAWSLLGAARIVLARELSMQEISEIRAKTKAELEVFVHGAMCISYSGRCYLSSYLTGRDGNRGECAQICRWKFNLTEANRPGQEFAVAEDERGTYIMNSKDLCLLPSLPQLIASGVNSLKIEGRMKSMHYVATVVSVYRKAIDNYFASPDRFVVKEEWLAELEKVSHRPYFQGFAAGEENQDSEVYGTSSYLQTHDFVGLVLAYDKESKRATIEQRNRVFADEVLEVLTPQGELNALQLTDIRDEHNVSLNVVNKVQAVFTISTEEPVEPYSLLRRKI